jgi:hypothetical protein
MSGLRRRVRRLKRTRPSERPENFDSLDPLEQLTWLARNNQLTDAVREIEEASSAEEEAKAAERIALGTPEPRRETEPTVEIARPAPLESKPEPPTKPSRPRHAGEPDPTFVPPQNQYWQTMCRFRLRQLGEPYDDQPPEEDELDELIYGRR